MSFISGNHTARRSAIACAKLAAIEKRRVVTNPRSAKLLSFSILAILVASCFAAQAQITATVDLNVRHQTFEGWGTSLAWWANVVGGFPDANRNAYITQIFDPANGLGLNIVRYNIGGGENPMFLPPNSTFLQFRARVPGFEASLGNFDWTKDANQRWVLQQSILKGVTIEEAFSNSPPWWMTNSGSVTGAQGSGDNLNPGSAANFADYLTTVVQHYHDNFGVTFRTLEAFNEPNSGFWHFGNNQEGCGFAPATQNSFIKTLHASLASKGISYATISASDENSIDTAVSSFASLDSTSKSFLSQVNTHTYNGSERPQLQSAAAGAHKRLWATEYGDGDASGLTLAARILNDLRNMQPNAWVYWQAVDNATGWGLLRNPLDGSSNFGFTKPEKYFVMANFTRFIRPGYQFIGMSDSNSVAAFDGNGKVAIVTLTGGSAAESVTYQLLNFGTGPWEVTPFQTSNSQSLAQLASFSVTGAQFSANLPAHSVTTFVLTRGGSQSGGVVAGKTYQIRNQGSGLLLDDPGSSTTSGTQMDQWTSNGGNNQKWLATAVGSNWMFTNIASGLALDVAGASTAAGIAVDQAAVTQNKSQVWIVTPAAAGTFTVTNQNSGLVLDVNGASTINGGKIIQWTSNGGTNQQWVFEPLD